MKTGWWQDKSEGVLGRYCSSWGEKQWWAGPSDSSRGGEKGSGSGSVVRTELIGVCCWVGCGE